MTAIEHAAVRAFLADADIRPEFAARAFARIEAQDADLGSSYLWSSRSILVSECAQEAEDLAAWAALIAARLAHDSDGSFADRRARALLSSAVQHAGEADTMLRELQRLLERVA